MDFFVGQRGAAVGLVERWLQASNFLFQTVSDEQLKVLGFRAGCTGWLLTIPSIAQHRLTLVLDHDFPFSLPRIFLDLESELALSPHVERSGRLCLTGDGGRVDPLRPVEVVQFSLGEAVSLLQGNLRGENLADFVSDFPAYWWRQADSTSPEIQVLLGPRRESRLVKAWHGEKSVFVAESLEDALSWMDNRYGPDKCRRFKQAAVIWMKSLPTPADYPASVIDLERLIEKFSDDGSPVFEQVMREMGREVAILLAGETAKDSISFAGVVVRDPPKGGGPAPKKKVEKGFRPGRKPPHLLAAARRLCRSNVNVVDAWRGTLPDNELGRLKTRKVAVIGCGSLGSNVCRLLLQSGVGSLLLIDHETLAWRNIGRHELGANYVGEFKSESLCKHFSKMFPHVSGFGFRKSTWQDAYRADQKIFEDCDLVLSLTGDWNSEVALDDLQRAKGFQKPILFGWMEAFAAAGHALLVGVDGPCLRCGFSPTGDLSVPITVWRDNPPFQCGGASSPYGAVDMAPISSLVASLAVDALLGNAIPCVRRCWIANSRRLEAGRGFWNPAWVAAYGDPDIGGRMIAARWTKDAECQCRM